METQLKSLKLMRAFFLAACVMYVLLAEALVHTRHPVAVMVFCALAAASVAQAAVAMFLRKKWAPEGPLEVTDEVKITRWRQSYIAPYALTSGVTLYGLVLRFLGAGRLQAAPFYVGGIAILVMMPPELPQA